MKAQFSNKIFAVLAASGFEEAAYLNLQKILKGSGAALKIISSDSGLIGGLSGSGWGHNHMVDAPLNTALGVDYDAVIILPGASSHKKLMSTAHTKRFVSSFSNSNKPVIAIGNAEQLLQDIGLSGIAALFLNEVGDNFISDLMNCFGEDEIAQKAA